MGHKTNEQVIQKKRKTNRLRKKVLLLKYCSSEISSFLHRFYRLTTGSQKNCCAARSVHSSGNMQTAQQREARKANTGFEQTPCLIISVTVFA